MNRHIMSVHDVPLWVPSKDMDVSLELSKDTIHITIVERCSNDNDNSESNDN